MNTLIVPCAGKSTRFPGMKPKWLLVHPDGKLMIEKALAGINLDVFDQVIITTVKEFDEKYEAALVLKQVFKNPKFKICILDDFTKSASETVHQTIVKNNVKGSVVVKDSDNCVCVDIPVNINNFIAGYDLYKHPAVSNIPGKSFLIINEQNIVQDIIEKKIVSSIICLGVYAFSDVEDFNNAYLTLVTKKVDAELFVSHIISYLLAQKKVIFEYIEATGYDDWGTLAEWQEVQKSHRTYFIDVDGVILKNCGQYGTIKWSNNREPIQENIDIIKGLQKNGGQIIITTSRTEEHRRDLENMLEGFGIKPYAILMKLNHSCRVLINDFAPTNPYPSCKAVSLPRNTLIKDYLE